MHSLSSASVFILNIIIFYIIYSRINIGVINNINSNWLSYKLATSRVLLLCMLVHWSAQSLNEIEPLLMLLFPLLQLFLVCLNVCWKNSLLCLLAHRNIWLTQCNGTQQSLAALNKPKYFLLWQAISACHKKGQLCIIINI